MASATGSAMGSASASGSGSASGAARGLAAARRGKMRKSVWSFMLELKGLEIEGVVLNRLGAAVGGYGNCGLVELSRMMDSNNWD